MNKPLYLVSGFLDSGKTSFIKETLLNPNFNEGERTMIIAIEEGDIEYDKTFLDEVNAYVIYFDSIKDLTLEVMQNLDKTYSFERIFLECNGMEDEASFLEENGLIDTWELAQSLCLVDASVFKLQNLNLRQFMYNHIRIAECLIFNRFDDDNDYIYLRNNVKAINPRVEIIVEDVNNMIVEFDDQDIFDLSSGELNISDIDYGMWYMDAANNSEKYENIKISLRMKFIEDLPQYENALIMGREAMVCCADDITDVGLTVIGVNKKEISKDKFYEVSGVIHCIDDEEGYKTCLLYASKIKECEAPKDELVYFN